MERLKYIFPVVYGCATWSVIFEGRTYVEGVGEYGAEGAIWASVGQGNRKLEESAQMRSFRIFFPYQTLSG